MAARFPYNHNHQPPDCSPYRPTHQLVGDLNRTPYPYPPPMNISGVDYSKHVLDQLAKTQPRFQRPHHRHHPAGPHIQNTSFNHVRQPHSQADPQVIQMQNGCHYANDLSSMYNVPPPTPVQPPTLYYHSSNAYDHAYPVNAYNHVYPVNAYDQAYPVNAYSGPPLMQCSAPPPSVYPPAYYPPPVHPQPQVFQTFVPPRYVFGPSERFPPPPRQPNFHGNQRFKPHHGSACHNASQQANHQISNQKKKAKSAATKQIPVLSTKQSNGSKEEFVQYQILKRPVPEHVQSENTSPKIPAEPTYVKVRHFMANLPNIEITFKESNSKPVTKWLCDIKSMWVTCKKSHQLSQMLRNFYDSLVDPYAGILYLIIQSGDSHRSNSKSLSQALLEEFETWQCESGVVVSVEAAIDAFSLSTKYQCVKLATTLSNIFNFKDHKEHFIDILKEMLGLQMFREVCQYVIMLDLKDTFSAEELLIPLLLLGYNNDVDSFLEKYGEAYQISLLSALDSAFWSRDLSNDVGDLIFRLGVENVPHHKITSKSIDKRLLNLVKKYNIRSDVTPNFLKRRRLIAIHYQMKKKFDVQNEEWSLESWREILEDLVDDCVDCQKELIEILDDYGDTKECLYWVNKYPDGFKQLTPYLQNYIRVKEKEGIQTAKVENWGHIKTDVEYLEKDPRIVWVCDGETMVQFLDAVKQRQVVGIDAEWKPVMVPTMEPKLSLMQVAISHELVYLIDMNKLSPMDSFADLWQQFLDEFLLSDNVMKIGFGMTQDYANIASFFGTKRTYKFLDLDAVWKMLTGSHNFKFPFDDDGLDSKESLSRLVYLCFGKHLDKRECFSNWDKRPLRPEQIKYAALDAVSLLIIYDILNSECSKQNINFELVCQNVFNRQKNNTTPDNKNAKKSGPKKKDGGTAASVSVDGIKFVSDAIVGDVGKLLRGCGIDTVMLTEDNRQEYLTHFESEGRYALSKEPSFSNLICAVSKSLCYCINSESPTDQLKEIITKYNIAVKDDDMNTRCQECNSLDVNILDNVSLRSVLDTAKELRTEGDSSKNPTKLATAIANKDPAELEKLTESAANDESHFYLCDACSHIALSTKCAAKIFFPVASGDAKN